MRCIARAAGALAVLLLAGCAAGAGPEPPRPEVPAEQIVLRGSGPINFSARPADVVEEVEVTLREDGLVALRLVGSVTYDVTGRWQGGSDAPVLTLVLRDGFDGSLTSGSGRFERPQGSVGRLRLEGTAYGGRFAFEFTGRELR